MSQEFDENAALQLAQQCTEWHGCASGDCPHDTYRECFDAVHIEGQREKFTQLKSQLEEKDARNAQMKSQKETAEDLLSFRTGAKNAEIQSLKQQLEGRTSHAEVMEYKASKLNELLRVKDKQLESAREVIEFYADQKKWNGFAERHHEMMCEDDHYKTGENFIYTSDEDFETEIPIPISSGGGIARKWLEENKK